MRAAIFQPNSGEITTSERLERLRIAAEQADSDLLVCPELFMSGYGNASDVQRLAEPNDGAFGHGVASIAEATGTAIVYGFPESAEGVLFNAVQCFDRTGNCVGHQRKLVLPPGFETELFTPGQGVTSFELHDLTFALLVCYDIEFPESARAVALDGADVIIVPTALGNQWGVVAHRVVPTRAFENGVYVIYSNHSGTDDHATYLGGSCIVGPDGQDIARAGDAEEILVANIDIEPVRKAQRRLPYHRDLESLRQRLQPR